MAAKIDRRRKQSAISDSGIYIFTKHSWFSGKEMVFNFFICL